MTVKNKNMLLGLMLILVSVGLCGCGISNGKAKKAAQSYIEEKYGQAASIVKIKKNYKFTAPGGGLLPTGIESDESYNLIMEIDGRQFDVCLIGDGSAFIGFDNFEEDQIRADVIDEIESQLDIHCEDIYLSYGEIYEKYGSNMIHDAYSDLASIYENGRFATIIATYDSINSEKVEDYATKYSVQDKKNILRIELIQYKDVIPELSFSSFSEVNDEKYALDWYTISNGTVSH